MSSLQSERNKALVRGLYEDCFNTGRLELARERLAPDFSAIPGQPGAESFLNTVRVLLAGFPDVRFHIEDLVAEGDRVVVRWHFQATHAGTFVNRAATGRRVTQTGTVIYQVREGRLARAWVQVDRLGLLQQLDAPAPALAPEPVAAA